MTSTGTLITTVLDELEVPYHFVDSEEVVIAIPSVREGQTYFIINTILGVNSESDTKLCLDKAYTYDVLHTVVRMPKTTKYLDPEGPYEAYRKHSTYQEVITAIQSSHSLPIIVKKNAGSLGSNVYCCQTEQAVEAAVLSVFNQHAKQYDHICLAQDLVPIQHEWRVLMYQGKLQFMYLKDTSQAAYSGNLSPLHWQNSSAQLVTDSKLEKRIEAFLRPIFSVWNLPYAGFDVVEDAAGALWLIEINSHPMFSIYLRDNDATPLMQMYRKILGDICGKKEKYTESKRQ